MERAWGPTRDDGVERATNRRPTSRLPQTCCAGFNACALSENDLRRAEELLAEGRRIVQRQKGRIVRLRAAGIDTWDAQRTLHLFEATLRRFEEHRDILKDQK